tara:strand:- start:353 stop:490 length:138 start_codon:yes stop_codon:yes gene_type:complete
LLDPSAYSEKNKSIENAKVVSDKKIIKRFNITPPLVLVKIEYIKD